MGIENNYVVFEKQRLNDFIDSTLSKKQDFQWASLLGLCMSLVYALYSKLFTTASPPKAEDVVAITLLIVFLLLALVLLGLSFRKWLKFKSYTVEFIKKAVENYEVDHDTTAVLLIKKDFGAVPKILVTRNLAWGYMLPYRKVTTALNDTETIKEVKSFFNNLFEGASGSISYLDSIGLENVIKINPKRNKIMKFSFGFFVVSHARYDQVSRHLYDNEVRAYEWKSVPEILNDIMTMKYNPEVINRLHEDDLIAYIPDSFESEKVTPSNLPTKLKVIWNITQSCSYDCVFCATSRDHSVPDASFEQRTRIAEELLKIPGVKIDIAGGDPLMNKDDRNIIFHILKYMAKDQITVTSTGKAIDSLNKVEAVELLKLCKNFDISYDFPSGWRNVHHRDPEYNRLNCKQLRDFSKNNTNVNVLVTLSPQNTKSEDIVDEMIKELVNDVHPKNIILLRLMPVGKQSYETYPSEYNPQIAIQKFKKQFGGAVKLHCAFRANLEDNGCCNMLTEKIGVDHVGNVFACAWAGYLDFADVTENPFFLGNLLDEGGIETICKSERYNRLRRITDESSGRGCRIFSYLQVKDENFGVNHDPLSNPDGP